METHCNTYCSDNIEIICKLSESLIKYVITVYLQTSGENKHLHINI